MTMTKNLVLNKSGLMDWADGNGLADLVDEQYEAFVSEYVRLLQAELGEGFVVSAGNYVITDAVDGMSLVNSDEYEEIMDAMATLSDGAWFQGRE